MNVYLIINQKINDMKRYTEEYIPKAFPFVMKYGGEIIVADFDAQKILGEPEKCAVVIKFPSKENLDNFLSDKDYQEVKQIRLSATSDANIVVANEFKM